MSAAKSLPNACRSPFQSTRSCGTDHNCLRGYLGTIKGHSHNARRRSRGSFNLKKKPEVAHGLTYTSTTTNSDDEWLLLPFIADPLSSASKFILLTFHRVASGFFEYLCATWCIASCRFVSCKLTQPTVAVFVQVVLRNTCLPSASCTRPKPVPCSWWDFLDFRSSCVLDKRIDSTIRSTHQRSRSE